MKEGEKKIRSMIMTICVCPTASKLG
jgi:hypothetical protein